MEKITFQTAIALGSNLGDTEQNLNKAIRNIQEIVGEIERVSSFYKSYAEGFESEHIFMNACLICRTELDPFSLLEKLKSIESQMGRVKTKASYEDRIIDLDIIFYHDISLHTKELTIPHPHFKQRTFVLNPLLEISCDKDPFWSFIAD